MVYQSQKSKVAKINVMIIFALFILAVMSFIFSIGMGVVSIDVKDVLRVFSLPEESEIRLVILGLRMPRALVGALVGVCLSLSGCILQGVMRNHLASPSTIGVTSGASFVGYLMLVAFPRYYYLLPIGTIIGSFLTTIFIYVLAYDRGLKPLMMILAGLAVSALFGAFNDVIKVIYDERVRNVQGFLIGGLGGTTWVQFKLILPFAVAGIFFCLLIPNKLNVLLLGDDIAYSLGVNVESFRLQLIIISSVMAGSAVAVAGMISFVGLIIPHISRLLVGSDYRYLMPVSALLSIVFFLTCDTIGRLIIMPAEVPVGIIISFIGAPFFLFLLRKKSKEVN